MELKMVRGANHALTSTIELTLPEQKRAHQEGLSDYRLYMEMTLADFELGFTRSFPCFAHLLEFEIDLTRNVDELRPYIEAKKPPVPDTTVDTDVLDPFQRINERLEELERNDRSGRIMFALLTALIGLAFLFVFGLLHV